MTAPSCSTERMQKWFDLASREGLDDEHWEIAAELPEAILSHRSAESGHLIKFHMKDIFIRGAPEKSSNLLVRPEVPCDEGGTLARDPKKYKRTSCLTKSGTAFRMLKAM